MLPQAVKEERVTSGEVFMINRLSQTKVYFFSEFFAASFWPSFFFFMAVYESFIESEIN